MAGIENLFSIEPTLPVIQGLKLPDNVERWSDSMTTYLRELQPESAKLPMMVEYRNRDDQSGTAIGAIHLSSEDGKKVILIPFIVNKFQLSPFDIWMETKSQAVHPLTKDTLKEQFFSTSVGDIDGRPGDGSGQYFNDPSLWTTNYPPLQGRYSYASAGYQILDEMSDTFTKEDFEKFAQTIKANPRLLAKFKKHGHAELIEKLARKTYVNTGDFTASAMKLIPTAVVNVRKDLEDKYSLLSCTDGIFDTVESAHVNREAMSKFVSALCAKPQDFLNELDQEGEKMLIMRKPAEGVFLYDLVEAKPVEATEFSAYVCKTKDGLEVEGVVLPYVVNFDGKKVNKKIFLGTTHAACQNSIAGIPVKDSAVVGKVLRPASVRVGQTGVFVYLDAGKAIATEPVTIKAIEQGGYSLSVFGEDGKPFKIRRGYGDFFEKEERESAGPMNMTVGGSDVKNQVKFKRTYLDAHGIIELRQGINIIPEKMLWVPINPTQQVVSTPAEYIQKLAFAHLESDPIEVRWTGIVYDIRGQGQLKMAHDEFTTKAILANHGLTQEKIAVVLKRAKTHGLAKIHGADRLKSKAQKKGEVASLVVKISSACKLLNTNLIKEAAEVEKDQTVDALLALNFLNPENVARFAAYKPVFEKVCDYLAELTLASRLGLNEVPEFAVVSAMNKVQEVCGGLEKLEASLKRPNTKS